MKKITKLLLTVALCALTIIAAGCGGDNKAADKKADPNAPVKIGVTAGPHAEIMDNVKSWLKTRPENRSCRILRLCNPECIPGTGRAVCQLHAACSVSGSNSEKRA